MDLKNLAKLKEMLVSAKEFFPVMDYFMTEFGDHEEFMDQGKRIESKTLETFICAAGREVFPAAPDVVLARATFVEIPAYNFTHGGLTLNRCMGSMIYFSDIQMGMLAVAMSMSGPTKFVRFSGKLLTPNREASEN